MFSRLPFRLVRLVILIIVLTGLSVIFVKQSQGNYPGQLIQLAHIFNLHLPGETTDLRFQISRDKLVKQLADLRLSYGLSPLKENEKLDQAALLVLDESLQEKKPQINDKLLDKAYRQVGFVGYTQATSNYVYGPEFMFATPSGWLTKRIINEDLKDPKFNQFGFAYKQVGGKGITTQYALVAILAAVEDKNNQVSKAKKPVTARLSPIPKNKPAKTPKPTRPIQPTPIKFPDISDQEVINALNLYRADHKIHQLVVDKNLCEYAEKRVNDLLKYGGLDNHEGFKKDFDVNDPDELPEPIKRYSGGAIGENLAYQYCRNMKTGESFIAQTGTALIEWCFDSSTKGHREAQLNPRYNAVCVRHANGYYVVIFGE